MLMESAFGLAGRTHESNNYNATVIKTPYLRESHRTRRRLTEHIQDN